ncbi:PD-(D/E)XK motif protein [Mesorhizobium sp. BH1-1-5]|uniref:PD-(D/E)XK motif protein n=1 Tax=Mesorhizobium sp. BH1-1-5 TaxID=2876661 RepID=UPI001CCCB79D|nr:PD-(D/E)XK motif protein [Mesorhizobium sp. BH1-1-5]MBZ9991400.1 PD-(D/E)XK motif protein [Mesorhizobium sp. BH1-1-5]
MTSWVTLLTEAWNELAHTAPIWREYRSKVLAGNPLEISAGMRAADNAPCLLLSKPMTADALFDLGGVRLVTVPDSRGPLLVLSLEDTSRLDLFIKLCADLVEAAASDRARALDRFLDRLDAWRQFLRDRQDGLSRSGIIGLVGELLVLERLLGVDSKLLPSWEAPVDGLHDFHSRGHALEIKTGLGPSPTITISRLDQLETADLGRLELIHVKLIEAPDGRTLGDIIASIRDTIPGNVSQFDNALIRRGLLPDDDEARRAPRVQIRSMDCYAVTDGFPRLRRTVLPVAITDATYTLDVRALSAFWADTALVLEAFIQGDRS